MTRPGFSSLWQRLAMVAAGVSSESDSRRIARTRELLEQHKVLIVPGVVSEDRIGKTDDRKAVLLVHVTITFYDLEEGTSLSTPWIARCVIQTTHQAAIEAAVRSARIGCLSQLFGPGWSVDVPRGEGERLRRSSDLRP